MENTAVSYVVRALLTPEEYKRLRLLAVERDQSIQTLITVALQTSPHTAKVFANGVTPA